MKSKQIINFFLIVVFVGLSGAIYGQSIDSLLTVAYGANPELKALQLEYEAALQKGPQVSQLSDPTVGLGVPILQPETRLGGQVFTISATQMFPWLGTLKAKEDVVLSMAKAKYERIAAARLNIDYQVKSAYYNLYLLQTKQVIIGKNIRIFEVIEKVALAKVESGKSIASDVLKVRIKIEELKQSLKILEEQKLRYNAAINAALNTVINIPIKVDTSRIDLAVFLYDLDAYRVKIEANHPLIRQLDRSIETSNKELALNDLADKPSFGVGLDYSLVTARTDAFPDNNGRDILIPKVMVSIPIYKKKYSAKKREEDLKKQAFSMQKEQLTSSMLGKIQGFKSEYESAKLMYELANTQIEISKSAYEILLTHYSSQGQKFDELMRLLSDITRFEIEAVKAVVKTHLAKFEIERLTDF
jgi:outer membrane protein TolC